MCAPDVVKGPDGRYYLFYEFAYLKTREKDKKNLHPYFTQSGADREDNPDQYIANMKDGSSAGFKYFNFNKLSSVSVSVRGSGEGKIEVKTQDGGPAIAEIAISSSADWTEFSADLKEPVSGEKALYFTYKGKGYIDFKEFELI